MISKIIPEEKIRATQKAINKAHKVVITAHKSPDGDAIGSCLGLYHFLYTQDKETTVIVPDKMPNILSVLPGFNEIIQYDQHREAATEALTNCDLIFCLDFNQLSRIGAMEQEIAAHSAPKILIDHHPYPGDFAQVSISHPEIASTSELIFRLICRMGYFADMTLESAQCICAGMMTDTGGLAFNSNNPEIYNIFAELLHKGVDKDLLYRQLFNTYSENRMRMMGFLLSERMKVYPEYHTAVTWLDAEDIRRFNPKNGDTEGFVNLPLNIREVYFTVFIKYDATGKLYKLSMRSQGDFAVNTVATELFQGGGHKNAAGAESSESLQQIIQKIEGALPKYIQKESCVL